MKKDKDGRTSGINKLINNKNHNDDHISEKKDIKAKIDKIDKDDLKIDSESEENSIDSNNDYDDDDPLFGDLNKNENLKSISLQKGDNNRKIESNKKKFNFNIKLETKKDNLKGLDILEQLNAYMKDPLDKELGFSMSRTLKNSNNLNKERNFIQLMDEVKRERQINKILLDDETEKNNEILNNIEIDNWINMNVSEDFLNLENNGIKVHGKWILQLKRSIKEIINLNNNKFDKKLVDTNIIKKSQYSNFKCFVNQGIYNKTIKDISFLFNELTIQDLIKSIDIKFIETIELNNYNLFIDNNSNNDLKQILEKLGFSIEFLSNKSIKKKFDNKKKLPPLGCGFQVYKFIKIIEIEKCFENYSLQDIIHVIILMIVDFNVNNDIQKFYYKNGYFTGKEICIIKLKELRINIDTINNLLNELFLENCPDLWFQLIKSVETFSNDYNDELEIKFINKLILRFLNDNKISDNVEIEDKFINIIEVETLFEIFNRFLRRMSSSKIQNNNDNDDDNDNMLDILLMKVELIKDFIIINERIVKKWREEDQINNKFEDLKKNIHKIKYNYFKEFDNSFKSNIPTCKKKLDFIYHELSGKEIGDFFIED